MRGLFITVFFTLFSLTQIAHAISCTPANAKTENNILTLPGILQPHTVKIYFFKNTSSQSLFIDRVNKNPSATAGWSTYIRPGNWAALAVNQKSLPINCVMVQPGKVISLNCSHALFICSPQNAAPLVPLKRSYWLAEDKSWEDLIKTLKKTVTIY